MALTLEEKLAEAESVYHDWSIGKVVRSFTDQNGERVEYSMEGMRRLAAYIADLKSQLGQTSSRPMQVHM